LQEFILEDIAPMIDMNELVGELHIQTRLKAVQRVKKLIAQASLIGRPRALYRMAQPEVGEGNLVTIDRARFFSRLLSSNLHGVRQVFPYIVTCGKELDVWARNLNNSLDRLWADGINELILNKAVLTMEQCLKKNFGMTDIFRLSPGLSEDWPLEQQRVFFSLFQNPEISVGVKLLPSFLMAPLKSVSGIALASMERRTECDFCSRTNCRKKRKN
jgi:hypothetical protein